MLESVITGIVSIRPGFHMCLKCLRHVPDTIELNGASTAWDMSQACLRHLWKPGLSLNDHVACLEAIHTMLFPTFLAGFCKI